MNWADLILIVSFSTFIFVIILIYLLYALVDKFQKFTKGFKKPNFTLDEEIQNAFDVRGIEVTHYKVAKKKDSKDLYIWTVIGRSSDGKWR